jgi:pyridoxal phosphate enzyme (YggS family)
VAVGVDLVANLARVHDRIEGAGGDPSALTLVAVTKGFGIDVVRLAAAAQLFELGENYVDEMHAKMAASRALRLPLRWHFLGHVQRNKVRKVANGVAVWQGVDRLAAGEEIAKRAPGATVLVQVNLTGADNRNGCTFDDAPGLVAALRDDAGLDVRGVMGVGPGGDPEDARALFRRLRALGDDLGLEHVSMGMTDDLEVAVQEGSTMLRLGTALFGPRPGAPRSPNR